MEFCAVNFGVTFPLFKKVEVNGKNAIALYQQLKQADTHLLKAIPWNFTKFLVGKDGQLIHRFAPKTEPVTLKKDIDAALNA